MLATLAVACGAFLVLTCSAAAAPMVGVQAHLLWPSVTDSQRAQQLSRLQAAGADIVRVDVGWSTLEPNQKGTYERWYLDRLDKLVSEAKSRHLKLLLTLTDSPCWASSAPESLKQGCSGAWWERSVQRYHPTRTGDYADALAFLIARYGERVNSWEVWNEPNVNYYFQSDAPAKDYAALLRTAYDRAKATDPRATIVGGALASADAVFVKQLVRAGIGGHFDIFSIHPYSEDRSPLDPFPDQWVKSSFIRGVPLVRKALSAAGGPAPIWLTEFGWSTCSLRNQPQAWQNCVDPNQQAAWIEQAYHLIRSWPYVKAAFVYEAADDTLPAGFERDEKYGLMTQDGTPKPAFFAFRRAAAEMHSHPPAASAWRLLIHGMTVRRRRNSAIVRVRVKCLGPRSQRCRGRLRVRLLSRSAGATRTLSRRVSISSGRSALVRLRLRTRGRPSSTRRIEARAEGAGATSKISRAL